MTRTNHRSAGAHRRRRGRGRGRVRAQNGRAEREVAQTKVVVIIRGVAIARMMMVGRGRTSRLLTAVDLTRYAQ